MKTLFALLLTASTLFAGQAAACDSYGCYTPSYNYGYNYNYGYQKTFFKSCYYSSWAYSDKGYHYSYCNYRPYHGAEYQQYVCIYYPGNSYCYYYNPIKKSYWGRYDYTNKSFHTLAPGDQRGTVAELNDGSFANAGGINIPDSTVGEQLLAPPAVPNGDVLPPA